MKLKYDAEYRCRACGIFSVKNQTEICESKSCPKCHRDSPFVRGAVWREEETAIKKIHKTQKRLPVPEEMT